MSGEPIKLAIVGVGQIATGKHLPVIAADPRFELVAVATKGALDQPMAVPVFGDHAAMLAAVPEIQAVAVCTPPVARYGVARDMILAGKHVLLEKPSAATLAEAQDLARLASTAGVTLFATWHSRFNAAVIQAAELLRERRVTRMDVQWREDVERYHPGQDWIWRAGGFGVFDPGINALSILTAILPMPLFVRSCQLDIQPGHQTPITAVLQFGPDLAATFDWRPGPDDRTIRIGTADGLELALLNSGRELVLHDRQVRAHEDDEYAQVYDRFARLIADGGTDADFRPQCLVADAYSLATIGL